MVKNLKWSVEKKLKLWIMVTAKHRLESEQQRWVSYRGEISGLDPIEGISFRVGSNWLMDGYQVQTDEWEEKKILIKLTSDLRPCWAENPGRFLSFFPLRTHGSQNSDLWRPSASYYFVSISLWGMWGGVMHFSLSGMTAIPWALSCPS